MASPSMTFGAAGNALASQSLSASASVSTAALDYSAKIEAQLHIKNTPAGSVSSTRGLRIDVYREYSTGPTQGQSPFTSYTLPSQTASTAESADIWVGTGKYLLTLTNLDGTNAVTVEITADTVDGIA